MKPVPGIVTQMETPPHIQRRIRYYRRRLHVLGLRLFEPGQYEDEDVKITWGLA